MSWSRRLFNTLRHGPVDREIQRELAFHIGERIDQLRAEGMSLEDARLAAHRQFGNALTYSRGDFSDERHRMARALDAGRSRHIFA